MSINFIASNISRDLHDINQKYKNKINLKNKNNKYQDINQKNKFNLKNIYIVNSYIDNLQINNLFT